MAHQLVQVPAFNPSNPQHPTAQEWANFQAAVNVANVQLQMGLAMMSTNPRQYQHPALPADYLEIPTTPTTQLEAATHLNTHLNGLLLKLMVAELNAELAAVLPFQPQQLNAPSRVKAALPSRFNGKPQNANTFIAKCTNYFILNPMTEEQQIRFSLQLMEGGAENWKIQQLQLLNQPIPPAHFATWQTFVAEFQLRFVDTLERKRAAWALNTMKVTQSTSARLFIDQIQEQCDKAGYTSEVHRMDLIRSGLKPELARALAGRFPTNYQDFIRMVVTTDEDLQQQKERERRLKKNYNYQSWRDIPR